ncbi:unnamed protein product [Zymoseptoria tritici ST99CH_1A5]|uniref:Uncharacterized protein n=1 Tax=Zymoseptoria tritici ST99CH_1A5 TaxID=1276529 RepID=A0A1Y6LX28_ZYMTR|nr:unnamed protein product [Zymoseptoria tritici ST99CH_1A5]
MAMPPKKLTRLEWASVIRTKLWHQVKHTPRGEGKFNGTGPVARALLAEARVVHDFDQAGIPFVRSYECASLDLSCPRVASPMWCAKSAVDRLLDWQEASDYLSFDVKYFEFTTDRQGVDYPFRPMTKAVGRDVGAYILAFQNVDDYVALVPKTTFEQYTTHLHGVEPLILGVMAWAFPFMVHVSHLAEAVRRILAAKFGSWYQNPTTDVTLTGWVPRHEVTPSLWISGNTTWGTAKSGLGEANLGKNRSVEGVLDFWQQVRRLASQSGVRADLNDVAPMLCDFYLRVDGIDQPIRIEHKYSQELDLPFARNSESPYLKNRQWHFIILQSGLRNKVRFRCLRRGNARLEWVNNRPALHEASHVWSSFEGENAVRDLLRYVRSEADAAIADADAVAQASAPGEVDGDALASSNAGLSNYYSTEEKEAPSLEEGGMAAGITWVCPDLLEQCAADAALLPVPLDTGFVSGTHAVICHDWNDKKKQFLESVDKKAPTHIFDPALKHATCCILNLVDWSGNAANFGAKGSQGPFTMRKGHWRQPVPKLHALWLATPLSAGNSQVFDSYAMIPDTHLTQFDDKGDIRKTIDQLILDASNTVGHDEADEGEDDDDEDEGEADQAEAEELEISDHRCGKYFLKIEKAKLMLRKPKQLLSRSLAVRRGSALVTDGHDPLDYMVKLKDGSIYRHLHELLVGTSETMRIQTAHTQTLTTSDEFPKAVFRLEVRELLQSFWDYGLWRRPHGKTYVRPAAGADVNADADKDMEVGREAAAGEDDSLGPASADDLSGSEARSASDSEED